MTTTQLQHVYERKFNTSDQNNSLSLIFSRINDDTRVLDIGCASGTLGSLLEKQKSCIVTGLDNNADAIEVAKERISEALVCDITSDKEVAELKLGKFDHIIFADVIEHIMDGEALINRFKPYLKEDGTIIISIPNVAHGSVRLSLLGGNFNYTEEGLLDQTHCKLYTYRSLLELFESCQLLPVEVLRTYLGVLDTEVKIPGDTPPEVIEFVEGLEEATTLQFIAETVPISGKKQFLLANQRLKNQENSLKDLSLYKSNTTNLDSLITDHIESTNQRFESTNQQLVEHSTRINDVFSNTEGLRGDASDSILYLKTIIDQHSSQLNELSKQNVGITSELSILSERIRRYTGFGPMRFLRAIRRAILGYSGNSQQN